MSLHWLAEGELTDYQPGSEVEARGQGAFARLARARQAFEARRSPVVLACDIMTTEVVRVSVDTSLSRVRETMRNRGFRHLPVVEAGKLVGVLSDRDLLYRHSPSHLEGKTAGQIMSRRVLTAYPEARIPEVARIMNDHRVSCVPIIQADRRLLGILTTADILACMAENAPLDFWL